jgi:hypothetical protein
MTEESALRRAVPAFLFLGLALRVWQWLAEGTLWLDEIVLMRNIPARPAPRGFRGHAPGEADGPITRGRDVATGAAMQL